MANDMCIVCGVNPRWRGPQGNKTLYRCETCQREQWRKDKAKQPKKPKGALLEDGTRRKVGKPKQDAPKPISANIAPEPFVVVHSPEDSPHPQRVKVLVINRKADKAQLMEVPVLSEVQWSKVRRPDDLLKLLRGSGTLVVYADRDKV